MSQLHAQSVSLMVSTRTKCNCCCKFCIAQTTPGCALEKDTELRFLDFDRLKVGLAYAARLGATHAILTGKAEPTMEDTDYLCDLIRLAREYVPLVDLHTNGILFQSGKKKADDLRRLISSGLTNITISIADNKQNNNQVLMGVPQSADSLLSEARDRGLFVRCSLVLCYAGIGTAWDVAGYVKQMGNAGAHAVVVREIWRPTIWNAVRGEVEEFNKNNWVNLAAVQDKWDDFMRGGTFGLIQEKEPLPWGQRVYVMGDKFDKDFGVNVTFARCDDAVKGAFLKSIVHKPDGHGYRNWDHNGDILY